MTDDTRRLRAERNRLFQKRVRERVSAGLPEDDEGDDFQPWVWKILFEELEAAAVTPEEPFFKSNANFKQVKDWIKSKENE